MARAGESSMPAGDDLPPSPRGRPHRRSVPPWVMRVSRTSWAFVGLSVATAIMVLAVVALQELVVPLVVAIVAAVLLAPAVDWLEARRIPRSVGALVCTLLVGIGAHLGPVLGSAAGLISGLVVALVLLYYLLKDGHSLVARFSTRGTPAANAQASRILRHAAGTIRANSRGRTILAAVQGVFVTIALWLLGVPLPASVGIVNFVGGFIPFLGAFVGGAFAVLMLCRPEASHWPSPRSWWCCA